MILIQSTFSFIDLIPIDKPKVAIRFDPPSPIIENQKVNVTLHCDIVDANPAKLVKVKWLMDGNLLTELPECNGKKVTFTSIFNVKLML